tara:strand:+ start:1865 stop:4339 length:2475 start_codon:yes stop_codon:yes gene_type:complete
MARGRKGRGKKAMAAKIAAQEKAAAEKLAKERRKSKVDEINAEIDALKNLMPYKEEDLKKTVELAQAEAKHAISRKDTLAALDANRKILADYKSIRENLHKLESDASNQQIERIQQLKKEEEAYRSAAEGAKEYVDEVENIGPAYEEALREATPMFEDMATHLGLVSKGGNKAAASIGKLLAIAKGDGGLRGLGKSLMTVLSPANIGTSLLTKIIEQTLEQIIAVDKAASAFAAASGMGRMYETQIQSVTKANLKFGLTADKVGKGFEAFATNLAEFNSMSVGTQNELARMVAGLEQIGVSGQEAVGSFIILSKSLGVTQTKAKEMTRELALSGKALGMSAGEITRNFNQAMGTLAVYGSRAPKIFSNLAAMAGAASVEVETLLGIANKFDTFSDAAGTAAKLNAILGTSFSGLNLQMMDHDERVKAVIQGMQAQGIQFKNLDKFTRQAIAAQLGIQNMAEANQILGMSTSAYDKLKKDQAAQKKTQDELNDRMLATVDAMTRMKLAMAEFAIENKDLLPIFQDFVKGLGKFIAWVMKNPYKVLGIAIGGFILKIIANAGAIAGAIKLTGAASASAAPGVSSLGVSMKGLAKGFLPVAIGVSAIIWAFSKLMDTMFEGITMMKLYSVGFKEVFMGLTVFAGGIIGLAVAVRILASASKKLTMTGPLGWMLGAAVAGIAGLAVGVANLGKRPSKPMMDTNSLIENAKDISDLTEKLQVLMKNRDRIEQAFSAIGHGLRASKQELTADVQSTIANLALMTTGQAAGDMNMTMASVSTAIGDVADAIKSQVSGNKTGDVYVEIKGKALKELIDGRVAKASKSYAGGQ